MNESLVWSCPGVSWVWAGCVHYCGIRDIAKGEVRSGAGAGPTLFPSSTSKNSQPVRFRRIAV
jgi:hypothetical protein